SMVSIGYATARPRRLRSMWRSARLSKSRCMVMRLTSNCSARWAMATSPASATRRSTAWRRCSTAAWESRVLADIDRLPPSRWFQALTSPPGAARRRPSGGVGPCRRAPVHRGGSGPHLEFAPGPRTEQCDRLLVLLEPEGVADHRLGVDHALGHEVDGAAEAVEHGHGADDVDLVLVDPERGERGGGVLGGDPEDLE